MDIKQKEPVIGEKAEEIVGIKQFDQGHVDPKEFEKEPVIVDAKGEEIHLEDKPAAEDRSAFNCEPCKGEGLLNQQTRCPDCNGTGKV